MSDTIRISEIFGPTIQGEGALIGEPTVFVRTGGCDFRCAWCDSLHAVDSAFRESWTDMSVSDVFTQIESLSGGAPIMITLSGGNPAIQPLEPLIKRGHAKGYRFAMETQGSIAPDWLNALDVLVLSPKPPSSQMAFDADRLRACVSATRREQHVVLKFIVLDETDYQFARQVAELFSDLPVFLQPCNHTPPPPDDDRATVDVDGLNQRMLWLVERTLKDQWYDARILPQLHVMLWGNKRGV